MKMMLALVAVLYSAAALAQNAAPPPMVGDKPLVQVKPRKTAHVKKKQAVAVRLESCLDIDDGTKGRLDCYDAVIPPAKPKQVTAKSVMDCKYSKEEDARLACFNGFVESMPKLPKS